MEFLQNLFRRSGKSVDKSCHENIATGKRLEHSQSTRSTERSSKIFKNRKISAEMNRHEVTEYTSRDEQNADDDSEGSVRRLDESRLAELLHGLRRIAAIRSNYVTAQIEARQKMREVGFKRSDVSQSDASFMKELQRLQAKGELKQFEQLSKLATVCQSARDGLGPLEEEGNNAQLRLEGEFWDLQQEEEAFDDKFAFEFAEAGKESDFSDTSDAASIQYEANTANLEEKHQHIDIQRPSVRPWNSGVSSSSIPLSLISPQQTSHHETTIEQEEQKSMLLGLEPAGELDERQFHHDTEWSSDLGIEELDLDLEVGNISVPIPSERSTITESFPRLIIDFSTQRDRIKKWLLHTMLVSKSEANLVAWQLAQSPKNYSAWAQVVAALLDNEATSCGRNQFESHDSSMEEGGNDILEIACIGDGNLNQPRNQNMGNMKLNGYRTRMTYPYPEPRDTTAGTNNSCPILPFRDTPPENLGNTFGGR